MAGPSSSRLVIYAALIGNSLIAATKFTASAFTGSSAMFSEAIHSLVDTGNQLLLLHGLRRAARPPDARFPFGYGKEIYFWSFVVAILIFALGAGISIYEGAHRIAHPEPVQNPLINFWVLGFAIVFESVAWYVAWREFKAIRGDHPLFQSIAWGKDPTVFVILFEDTAAILGLFVALGALLLAEVTGNTVFDGIGSIIIGCILGATACWLAMESKGLLIGEAANSWVQERILQVVQEDDAVVQTNELLTMHVGPEYLLVNISVKFADGLDAEAIERAVAGIDARVKAAEPRVRRLFIEAESWPRRRG